MHVDSRGEGPALLAVQLVNDPVENPAELELVCRAAGVVVEQPATHSDVVQLNERLSAWQQLADEPDVPARVAMLNHLLEQSVVGAPTLTMHNDQPLHLHYREDTVSLWQSLEAMILVGTAMHFVSRGATRLGRCAEPACERVFVDISRPGTQRFCSTECANRAAVRRHRDRAKTT
jgi:predicted RNA-binding Zn ribbon-like protein